MSYHSPRPPSSVVGYQGSIRLHRRWNLCEKRPACHHRPGGTKSNVCMNPPHTHGTSSSNASLYVALAPERNTLKLPIRQSDQDVNRSTSDPLRSLPRKNAGRRAGGRGGKKKHVRLNSISDVCGYVTGVKCDMDELAHWRHQSRADALV